MAESAKLASQYDAYEGVPGAHINGNLTLGENIADLGGLLVAIDAYHASLGGKPAPIIDGLTGDQRLFLGYAQSWRGKARDDALRAQMASDPHSPRKFRVIGATRNVDSWYQSFDVDRRAEVLPEAGGSRSRLVILVHTTSHRFRRGLGFELSLPPFPFRLIHALNSVTTGEPPSATGVQLQVIDVLLDQGAQNRDGSEDARGADGEGKGLKKNVRRTGDERLHVSLSSG